MKKKWIWIVPAAICGLLLIVFVGGELVQHLWNWLLPPLFGFRLLTFWQALGLLALCRILFGGHGFHGKGGSGWRRRREEHFAKMTPEERERFKQGMCSRWGRGQAASEPQQQ
jgi:hypothetical protein